MSAVFYLGRRYFHAPFLLLPLIRCEEISFLPLIRCELLHNRTPTCVITIYNDLITTPIFWDTREVFVWGAGYCICRKVVITMELTEVEAKAIKAIYTDYHAGVTNADEALHALEQLINAE